MEMPKEMMKLRAILSKMNIPYADKSEICPPAVVEDSVKRGIPREFADTTVFRTHFTVHGYFFSVVNGYGTYGGYELLTGKNAGLLECMTNGKNGGEPIGYLTAEEVKKIIYEVTGEGG